MLKRALLDDFKMYLSVYDRSVRKESYCLFIIKVSCMFHNTLKVLGCFFFFYKIFFIVHGNTVTILYSQWFLIIFISR